MKKVNISIFLFVEMKIKLLMNLQIQLGKKILNIHLIHKIVMEIVELVVMPIN